jgi:hypothetical protein
VLSVNGHTQVFRGHRDKYKGLKYIDVLEILD